jgi:hypothetical protein
VCPVTGKPGSRSASPTIDTTASTNPSEIAAKSSPGVMSASPTLRDSASQPGVPQDQAWNRVVFATTSLLSLLIGGLAYAYAYGDGDLRAGALLYFCLVGIGSAPFALCRSMRLPARVSLTFLVSMSVLTIASLIMSDASIWHPVPVFVAVACLAAAVHTLGLLRGCQDLLAARHAHSGDPGPASQRPGIRESARKIGLSWPAIAIGTGLWLSSALTHRHIDPGFGGFLTTIGPSWYVGVVLVLFGLFWARDKPERVAAVAVVALMLAFTLTPSIVYDGARSTTGAKHVGLIQQIRAGHPLDTTVAIYNDWDGFFAAMAWLFDILGIKDPSYFTAFWPSLIGFFRIGALRYLAGRFLSRSYHAWTAVALCVLADPIGADYFSPQSVGFVVGITVFGLALSPASLRLRASGLLLAGCLLAVSHQLSPYVTAGVLIVMVVFRQLRPWWTPLLVLLPANLWALLHRGALKGFINLREIGQAQNFSPPQTPHVPGLTRLPIVADASWALVLGIAVLACLAAISILRFHDRRAWSMGFCSLVGFVFVAVNPYGNEGIFRAFLFSIPWLVLLTMRWVTTRSWEKRAMFGLRPLMVGLTATFLAASFGLDAINVVKPGDLLAFQTFEATVVRPTQEPAVLMQLGPRHLPGILAARSARQTETDRGTIDGDFTHPIDTEPAAEVVRLTAQYLLYTGQNPQDANLYVVWSPLSSEYARAYALEQPATFAGLRNAFRASLYWNVVTDHKGTILFRFDGAAYLASLSRS